MYRKCCRVYSAHFAHVLRWEGLVLLSRREVKRVENRRIVGIDMQFAETDTSTVKRVNI